MLKIPCFITALVALNVAYAQDGNTSNQYPKLSEEWRYEVTPYIWLPGIKGTMEFNNGLAKSADFSSSNVLDNLKSGGMITAEAHKGNWGIMGDLIVANLEHSGSIPVYGGVAKIADKITLEQTIFTGAATYTIANTPDAYVDALFGARAINVTATLNGSLAGTSLKDTISKSTSTVDPIIGAKGRYRIADSGWYIPAYADIGSGGGTTNLTWQVMAGLGKSFGSLIDGSLTYRTLYYDMRTGDVLQKTTMQGIQANITFKF